MSIALYTLQSPLHRETLKNPLEEPFITSIEQALGEKFECFHEDFSSFGTHTADLVYVRTGGTEGLFKASGIKGRIRLLTSGESNSLAASMEILSYLRQNGREGEILHGSPEHIAEKIKIHAGAVVHTSPFIQSMSPFDMGGVRLGVIGKPSDWLISSGVDYAKAQRLFNAELIDIPMDELVAVIKKHDVDLRGFGGSEAVYDSLKTIIARYGLGGLTLRCFDLLDSVHNTGCLALARLNSEGIPSSCEGDIPALLSMIYLHKTTGCPGFQCNLSRIEGDELLFAHCTLPLSMAVSYGYTTHFESGIGTAVKAEMRLGDVEIFKISPDLERCVRIPGKLVRNLSLPNLCRTQIVVSAPSAADYFLHEPLANHHIISYK